MQSWLTNGEGKNRAENADWWKSAISAQNLSPVWRGVFRDGLPTPARVVVNAVQFTGELLIIVSLSFALGAGLTNAHVPEALVHFIDFIVVGESEYLRLLALVFLAILAGMILDPLIPVLVPIILPTLLAFNVDLIHFGVLMVIAVVIGQVTPPMAIALIISGRIANVDQMEVLKANMPFFWGIIAFLLLADRGAGSGDLAALAGARVRRLPRWSDGPERSPQLTVKRSIPINVTARARSAHFCGP